MGEARARIDDTVAAGSRGAADVTAGYRRTEVGVIPKDWCICRLDSLGTGLKPPIKAGPFGSSLTKAMYVSAGYKIYGQEQVIRGDPKHGDYFITRGKYRDLESCAVHPGDILMSLVGTVGKLLVVPDDAELGIINPRLIRFSFDRKRILPGFFRLLFESKQVQLLLSRSIQGGTMGILNAGILLSFSILVPPLSEQRAIAEALSVIDGLLGSLDALIAKKMAIKQAAMQQLLHGKIRLPGFTKKWNTVRLGDLLMYERPDRHIVRTESLKQGEVPVLTANKSFIIGYTQENFGICRHLPTIIFDDFTTESKYVDFPFKVKSSAIKLLRAKDNRVHLPFIFDRMQVTRFSLGDHKRYYISEYQEIELPMPQYDEQVAIASSLSDMAREIAALEARRFKARSIRQGMMQQLLTGRVRLVAPTPSWETETV